MILSASRRTDLPAFYAQWMARRFQEGYALVRNPMNYHQVSKILLDPGHIDGIVFWTKNPAPLLPYLKTFAAYPYYFQYTLTSYGHEMEPGIPEKGKQGIATFQRLSDLIGGERVIWRYDPILFSSRYSMRYHLRYFEQLAGRLEDYTQVCVISFLDFYPSIEGKMRKLGVRPMQLEEMQSLAQGFAKIAQAHKIRLMTCTEKRDVEV